jgi:hypothetical protein
VSETQRKCENAPEAIPHLSLEQYRVTQQGSTERAGTGKYLDNTELGNYVDVVSGEPLFASSDKHEWRCGWPSFTKPTEPISVAWAAGAPAIEIIAPLVLFFCWLHSWREMVKWQHAAKRLDKVGAAVGSA